MIERTKEVRYDIYCRCCKYLMSAASEDPCNECLGTPSNGDSHVPVNFYKDKPFINYLNEDPVVLGYTRDFMKSKNWQETRPTESELQKYFEKHDDGDWYEKEITE